MRVSSGEGRVMEYAEKGRHASWPYWDFLRRVDVFLWPL